MERDFARNAIKPGDINYKWEISAEFEQTEHCSWDDDFDL